MAERPVGSGPIALVFPSVLGTYGDGGNATVLAQRLRWRGIAAETIDVDIDEALPSQADLYVLGGGEDSAQTLAVSRLATAPSRAPPPPARRSSRSAPASRSSARRFLDGTGATHAGLGLIDCRTDRLAGPRAVGELLGDCTVPGVGTVTGYENHGGRTVLGSGRPTLRGGARAASAMATLVSMAPCRAVSSRRTCTVRRSPATRRSPTSCCGGWSGT